MKSRLLALLAAVIASDFGLTLLGQPAAYWHDPHAAREANPLFAWFMVRGLAWYLPCIAAYTLGVVALVRALPRQTAIVVGLVFLLAHYFAACTWLTLRFDLGMTGPVVYATVLAIALTSILQSAKTSFCSDAP